MKKYQTENQSSDSSKVLFNILKEKGLTIAFAESMTAGLLSANLARHPGASAILKGGVFTYSKELKTSILGVKTETLDTFSAESAETTIEMALGLEKLIKDTDLYVSLTGVASTPNTVYQIRSAVGTVFICIVWKSIPYPFQFQLTGNREEILQNAVDQTYKALISLFEKPPER